MLTTTATAFTSSISVDSSALPVAVSRIERSPATHRVLRPAEIAQLTRQGCEAEDWNRVRIAPGCQLSRIRFVTFVGDVRLGSCRGQRELPGGLRQPTGVWQATLQDCTLGDEVLIRNVRQGIAGYDIEDRAVICDVGSLTVDGPTAFGNGQEVHVLREDGLLPVTIYDHLTSNIAALLTATGQGGPARTRIQQLIESYVAGVQAERGRVGRDAVIQGCGSLHNVLIGPAARVLGAARLSNVSLNSTADSPVEIGSDVILTDSIVSSGTTVDSGAIVSRCFLGQGVRMGKHYSATDSLFFANAEAFHGEACSLLAGPYTVTHHKSTLLIAVQTSFFNAGAGTNQCNHAYKTGPAHDGVFERGCKTGGSSCVSWPANVGAFSTLLGKHRSGFDTRDFPFSFVVESQGETRLIPGHNLLGVGLWRDVRKWQARDRRTQSGRLDLLHQQALSPWTVQRMLRGRNLLEHLGQDSAANTGWIEFAGARIKRKDVQRGCELYRRAIRRYLTEQIVQWLESQLASGQPLHAIAASDISNEDSAPWSDVGGCFVAAPRLSQFLADLSAGRVGSTDELQASLVDMWQAFERDEWQWALQTWLDETGKAGSQITVADLIDAVRQWRAEATWLTQSALDDGQDDLGAAGMWDVDRRSFSKIGEEPSPTPADPSPVVTALQKELAAIESRASALLAALEQQPLAAAA